MEINKKEVPTLLDTGSLAGNFVDYKILVDNHLDHHIISSTCSSTVCSGLDNSYYELKQSITLTLSYFCSHKNKFAPFNVDAFILKNSLLNLIIGLPSIRELNLFNLFPEHIGLTRFHSSSVMSALMCMPCGCQPEGEFATPDGSQKVPLITQSLLPTTTPTHIIHASLILESEHILGALYGTYCTYIPYRSAPYVSCTKIPYLSSVRYLQKHIVALVLCVANLALCSLSAQLVTNLPS